MKVQILVNRGAHFFFVRGRTIVEFPHENVTLDPLMVYEPEFLSPPIPPASADPMTMTMATVLGEPELTPKFMLISQQDIVVVTVFEDEKDDGTD